MSTLPGVERFQARDGTSLLTICCGANDELRVADKYAEAVRGVASAHVKLIDGLDHMGIVSNPAAVSIIADDVATSGASS
jgi:hypothetical protein